MSWLCPFLCLDIDSQRLWPFRDKSMASHKQYQLPILQRRSQSPKEYLHQLILPPNIVALELTSAIKYLRTDFWIFTLGNTNKVSKLLCPAAGYRLEQVRVNQEGLYGICEYLTVIQKRVSYKNPLILKQITAVLSFLKHNQHKFCQLRECSVCNISAICYDNSICMP